ncbi:MAG: FHA domain-containing protein [Chloroflexi bacterium]|nr:FHA domain-containing protein [Chloroflexota bacterium]
MTTEVILLILRVLAGLALLVLLGLLCFALWRDYRSAANEVEARRRVYGQLIRLQKIDGTYTPTGETFPLLPLTSLGRSPTNTIAINNDFASSEHALVALRNGQWWLEDRQSRNGTTVNGIAVSQPIIITDGDIIGIGAAQFRLELDH